MINATDKATRHLIYHGVYTKYDCYIQDNVYGLFKVLDLNEYVLFVKIITVLSSYRNCWLGD